MNALTYLKALPNIFCYYAEDTCFTWKQPVAFIASMTSLYFCINSSSNENILAYLLCSATQMILIYVSLIFAFVKAKIYKQEKENEALYSSVLFFLIGITGLISTFTASIKAPFY